MVYFKKFFTFIFFFFFLISQNQCTPKQIASDITSQIMKSGSPAFEMEADVEIAEQAGLTSIKLLEVFQHDNPKNKNYLILLARSYGNYAFGFLEWNIMKNKNSDENLRSKNEQRAKNFYAKGKDYSLRILTRNAIFEKALTKDIDTFKKALKKMGRSQVPAMFWTAFNWGSYINLNKDSPIAIAEFPKAEAIMERVAELDPYYFYGGPQLFFGVSFGSRPPMFGGNPTKSKEHFENALKAYDRKFLLTQVLYAQTYCVQNQDRTCFDELLNEVLQARADALPEQRLGNELAKLRAQWLLDHASEMF